MLMPYSIGSISISGAGQMGEMGEVRGPFMYPRAGFCNSHTSKLGAYTLQTM